MYLLNLDSQELVTNENLQEVTSLLKDHYDLLVRFSRIFMPSNYKLAPWKDMTNNRVYCMLIKGDAMYKLTALNGEIQQYDAIEAAKFHEDQIDKTKHSSHLIPRVSIDNDSLSEELQGLLPPGDGSTNSNAFPIPLEQYNKLIENAITINVMPSQFQSTDNTETKTTKPEITTTTTTTQEEPPPPSRKRPSSSTILEQPVEKRGSRTRPSFRKFSLAVPFLYDLSTSELMEFLHHKGIIPPDESPLIDKEHTVKMIIKDCNFSDSTPFEVLPTFLKNFKNR
jgi:hypothetical protein